MTTAPTECTGATYNNSYCYSDISTAVLRCPGLRGPHTHRSGYARGRNEDSNPGVCKIRGREETGVWGSRNAYLVADYDLLGHSPFDSGEVSALLLSKVARSRSKRSLRLFVRSSSKQQSKQVSLTEGANTTRPSKVRRPPTFESVLDHEGSTPS